MRSIQMLVAAVFVSGLASAQYATAPRVSANGQHLAYRGTRGIVVDGLPVAPGDHPAISGDGRFVAYERLGHVLVTDRVLTLEDDCGQGANPSISADGNLVAFDSMPVGTNVHVLNRATGAVQTILSASHPALSPDGQFVGYDFHRPTSTQVLLLDLATGRAEGVSEWNYMRSAGDCVVSAGGRYVAYILLVPLPNYDYNEEILFTIGLSTWIKW
jgi:hypothetical protein